MPRYMGCDLEPELKLDKHYSLERILIIGDFASSGRQHVIKSVI
jgi:hypothetical protein